MEEKILEILNSCPRRTLYIPNKKIIIEDKPLDREYFITSLSVEDDMICVNYLMRGGYFISSSPIEFLPKRYIAEILTYIL